MDRKQNLQRLSDNFNQFTQHIEQQKQKQRPQPLTEDEIDIMLSNGIGTVALDAIWRLKNKI